jgi:hypothetical protein
MARLFPGLGKDEVLHCNQLQRTIGLRLVDEDGRVQEIGMRAGAGDARVGRARDAEHVGPEIVDAHPAELAGQARTLAGSTR